MNQIMQKTLGGLSKQYYFRQFFFGCLFLAFFIWISMLAPPEGTDPTSGGMHVSTMALFVVNSLLYPYSRFVYETVIDFIIGDNVFFGSAVVMMMAKFFTMFLCWVLAIFIAPIGFLYLYFHHTKQEKLHEQ